MVWASKLLKNIVKVVQSDFFCLNMFILAIYNSNLPILWPFKGINTEILCCDDFFRYLLVS